MRQRISQVLSLIISVHRGEIVRLKNILAIKYIEWMTAWDLYTIQMMSCENKRLHGICILSKGYAEVLRLNLNEWLKGD